MGKDTKDEKGKLEGASTKHIGGKNGFLSKKEILKHQQSGNFTDVSDVALMEAQGDEARVYNDEYYPNIKEINDRCRWEYKKSVNSEKNGYQQYEFVDKSKEFLFPHGWDLSSNDIKQRNLGECFFDAAILSIANYNSYAILSNMFYDEEENKVYVKLYDDDGASHIYKLDASVLQGLRQESGSLVHYDFNQSQFYVGVLQKAYAIHRQRQFYDQTQLKLPLTFFLNGGQSSCVFDAVLGGKTQSLYINPTKGNERIPTFLSMFIKEEINRVLQNKEALQKELYLLEEIDINAQDPLNNSINSSKKVYLEILEMLLNENVSQETLISQLVNIRDHINSAQKFSSMGDGEFSGWLTFFEQIESQCPLLNSFIKNTCSYLTDEMNFRHNIEMSGEHQSELENYITKTGDYIQTKINKGHVVAVSTPEDFGENINDPTHREKRKGGMVGNHAYGFYGTFKDGNDQLRFRVGNPWQYYSSTYQSTEEGMQIVERKGNDKTILPTDEYKKELFSEDFLRDTIHVGQLATSFAQMPDVPKRNHIGESPLMTNDFAKLIEDVHIARPSNELILLNAIQKALVGVILRVGVLDQSMLKQLETVHSHLISNEKTPIEKLADIQSVFVEYFKNRQRNEFEHHPGELVIYDVYDILKDLKAVDFQSTNRPSFETAIEAMAKFNDRVLHEFPKIGLIEAFYILKDDAKKHKSAVPKTYKRLCDITDLIEKDGILQFSQKERREKLERLLSEFPDFTIHEDKHTLRADLKEEMKSFAGRCVQVKQRVTSVMSGYFNVVNEKKKEQDAHDLVEQVQSQQQAQTNKQKRFAGILTTHALVELEKDQLKEKLENFINDNQSKSGLKANIEMAGQLINVVKNISDLDSIKEIAQQVDQLLLLSADQSGSTDPMTPGFDYHNKLVANSEKVPAPNE
ncbi:hypothetical protein L3V79_00700 [Thiotrichales bacterium 19S9-12]|nr:hypothetical protein [Thiotrichales bacterium 19S9-11]MCF6810879.1 hypothetical protein [Thiotrichales bacterium 19S9-12]